MSDEQTVKISLDVEDILSKSLEKQVKYLVKVAFLNHQTLKEHGRILFGDGDPAKGLCSVVDLHTKSTKALWACFVGAVTGFAGWIAYHLR